MKLLVGTQNDTQSVFRVKGDAALNLTAAYPEVGTDLSGLIGNPALPVGNPGKILCLGLNYIEHIKEGAYDIPDYPAVLMRTRQSIMAAGAPLVRPQCSEQLDYEAELMIVIGMGGRHIPEASALEHVFGYTVFNDGSVRDYQRKTHQWTPGKPFAGLRPEGAVTPRERVPSGTLSRRRRFAGNVPADAPRSDRSGA